MNLEFFSISWSWWISQNLDLNIRAQLISLVEFDKWILRAFEFIHISKLEIYVDYVQFTTKFHVDFMKISIKI